MGWAGHEGYAHSDYLAHDVKSLSRHLSMKFMSTNVTCIIITSRLSVAIKAERPNEPIVLARRIP